MYLGLLKSMLCTRDNIFFYFLFKRFELATIVDSSLNKILIPDNIDRFVYDYEHSKFIECNSKLANENYELSNGAYSQNTEKVKKLMPCLIYLADELENMYKHYWMSSGTLLGLELTFNYYKLIKRKTGFI